jgi:hypothetical protein
MSKASKVIAYKNTDRVCFCQIKFSSRERILISIATVPEHSIKVIKLLAGIIPFKTIWEFNATKAGGKDPHAGLIAMFTDQTAPEDNLSGRALNPASEQEGAISNRVKHPLDAIILRLITCRSCDEAVRVLQQAEKAYRNS